MTEKKFTHTFSVDVRYDIQIPQETADFIVEQYLENPGEYSSFSAIAEALEEAIAWRSANIVDAQCEDVEEAANSFLEMMGVPD